MSERQKQVLRRPESFIDDGKYNCQPEYRKAYLDYLIREKLPRNLDDEGVDNQDVSSFFTNTFFYLLIHIFLILHISISARFV